MNDKEQRREYFRKGLTAFLVVAASILFYFLLFRIGKISGFLGEVISVLQPVIFGIVIAYIVNPLVNFFNGKLIPFFKKRMKSKQTARKTANAISTAVSLIIFCIVLVGVVWLVVPQFIKSISNVITVLPGQLDALLVKAEKLLKSNKKIEGMVVSVLENEKSWLQNDLADTVNKFATSVASGVWSAVNFVKNLGIGLIFAIYILLSKRTLVNQSRKVFFAVFKDKTVKKIFSWCKKIHSVFSGFIIGKIIDSIIIGIICFLGVLILGTPYPVLIAVIIGVTNVIPVFGPWIGGIPCTLLVLLTNPIDGLYLGIFIILLQALDGNLIGPKILGDKTGLNTFWVIFAIVLGGGLFGVVGMLIGVPTFAVVYCVFAALINYLLRKKNKSTNSADYADSNGDLPKENDGGVL